MKILLVLCMVASLVHLGVQQSSYLTIKIPRSPLYSSDYAVTVAVALNYKPLSDTYEDISKPGSTSQCDGVTVFLKNDQVPLNKNHIVIATDFGNPTNVTTMLNKYVTDHTSAKIKDFFRDFQNTAKAVVLKCNDNWKVPDNGKSKYSGQLIGQYNALFNNVLGFTMIEIPKDKCITALYIVPDEGKEKSVEAAINSANLEQWRKLLSRQSINVELPRATLYACAALVLETGSQNGFEYLRTKFSASIAATIP